jgi:hypothetical protein
MTSVFPITDSPITFLDSAGHQRIYVFAQGSNGHLVVNYWDGVNWHWADQGLPAGTTSVWRSSPITYVDSSGHRRIYVFARADNGHIVVNYWDGFSWHWADHGTL